MRAWIAHPDDDPATGLRLVEWLRLLLQWWLVQRLQLLDGVLACLIEILELLRTEVLQPLGNVLKPGLVEVDRLGHLLGRLLLR